MPEWLSTGPDAAAATLLLAHGAGGPMDSRFMNEIADLLADRGIRVMRFEFGYMAARRNGGKRRPAPKAETLGPAYREAVREAREGVTGRLAIGGKSMGGRVASLVADDLLAAGSVQALVCLGYPFHPPNMPEKLRSAHLEALRCPALVIQGERDPFGSRSEIEALTLSPAITLAWSDDGDHDLGPRGASGFTRKGNLIAAADRIAAFLSAL